MTYLEYANFYEDASKIKDNKKEQINNCSIDEFLQLNAEILKKQEYKPQDLQLKSGLSSATTPP